MVDARVRTRHGVSMAYDEMLAERIREFLLDDLDVVEKRMFGGIAFMVNTHMACGVLGDDLMVRVGRDLYEEALQRGAHEMDFTGRPMRGLVMVDGADLADDGLGDWLELAVDVAMAEPPKPAKSARSTKAPKAGT